MSNPKNILDYEEATKSNLDKIIERSFFLSIPLIIFLSMVRAFGLTDTGFFLPRTEMLDWVIPESLIYIKDNYEIRIITTDIAVWISFYFALLGMMNIVFWKKKNNKTLRISHIFLTVGLVIIFFLTMIEDDIFHELKIRDPIGKIQFHNETNLFYWIFFFWIFCQTLYFLTFFKDKLFPNKK